MEQTTDQQKLVLTWKVAVPIMFSLLVISNAGTNYINVQNAHQNQIEYNDKAQSRRIKNAIEKLKLESEIEQLKKELNECL